MVCAVPSASTNQEKGPELCVSHAGPDVGSAVTLIARPGSSRLLPVPIREFSITGGFWARRQEINRLVSEPSGFESLRQAGTLGNLEAIAAGGPAGAHRGEYFADSDVYKWLEAIGWELGRGLEDASAGQLRSAAEQAIALVQAAQAPDQGLADTHDVAARRTATRHNRSRARAAR
jgi:uncharacterized protein